jgi:site-specific DNA-methyltransferase (adenine-specific)
MGWHYRRSYETVLVGRKRGGRLAWFDSSHRIENVVRHIRKIIPRKTEHPTAKPPDLFMHFARLHCPPGGVILDPFLGSGTAAVAARAEGMRLIGVEKEAKYLRMAVKRLAAKT